ncbi:MAG: hypothetical protein IK088_01490, partial [Lachnospiraceae bacterium]|nr:hypothetical protein [Lachnospiraceae bacterium]
VVNYNRHSHSMNLGVVIFLVIFLYLLIAIFNYFSQKHIESYQVKMGALSSNNIYKGVALRDETIVTANDSGYVNYFAREGERVGVGNLVYSLDESGRVASYFTDETKQGELKAQDLTELKTDILSFVNTFDPTDFSGVYDFKYNVEGTVLKLSNANVLADIDRINSSGVSDLVNFNYSPLSGYVIYSTDGYETLRPEDMTEELLDYKEYTKDQLISNDLVGTGEPVYKLATNEDWSIVIETDAEKAEELLAEDYIKVKFLKNQDTSWGKVSTYTNDEGNTFVAFTFNNSMMTFCTDRFVDIELILQEDSGLKVPNSSIVEKEFFIIPKEYLTKGGNANKEGVLREFYLEDGTQSSEFIETNIYSETETEYYIDDMMLRMGDNLVAPDNMNRYALSRKGSLIGVYNINKGYADFKEIQILYQNDEYSIVKPNSVYGLSAYDYIVLDASTVNEDELIYE